MFTRLNFLIHKIAAKDESRYTLNAMLATPDYTEATNGHILMRVSTVGERESFSPAQIPRKIAAAFSKLIGKRPPKDWANAAALPSGTITNDQDRAELFHLDLNSGATHHISFGSSRLNWPNTEALLAPTTATEPDVSIAFNPAYLRDLCSVFADAGALPVRFKFWAGKHNSLSFNMVRMDAEVEGQKLTAVIMPMKY